MRYHSHEFVALYGKRDYAGGLNLILLVQNFLCVLSEGVRELKHEKDSIISYLL